MKRLTKILLLIVNCILLINNGWGQNLVPNPSFEVYSNCPSGGGQVFYATGWTNYSNQSPDYFHTCATDNLLSVPNNWGGYQMPSSGNAYCALSTFYSVTPNEREVIGCQLVNNLVIGTKYYVSFKTNLSIDEVAHQIMQQIT